MAKATKGPGIRDRVKELRRVRAGDLLPNPRNWRRHPKAQRAALEGVLAEIGFAGALLARETPDGLMLIDGHLRAETAPDLLVPVLVLDVTEAEADRLLATLDPLSAMAQPDPDALLALLGDVSFDSEAVTAMLEALANGSYQALAPLSAPGGHSTSEEDEEAAAREVDKAEADDYVPFTKPGQLWRLGNHRLLCGDSTKAEDVARLMADERAEVLWTDPPYGVSYVGKTKKALTIHNDDGRGTPSLLAAAFRCADAVLAPSARIYLAAPAGPPNLEFRLAFRAVGWKFHQGLIWCKDAFVLGHSDYHVQHEDILYGWKRGEGRAGRGDHEGTRWYGDHAQATVFHVPKPKRNAEHPTMKPVALVERCLQNSSRKGDVVLDVFGGSGTTLLASEALMRQCRMLELDPRYSDVIIRRWEAFTGGKAELAEGAPADQAGGGGATPTPALQPSPAVS